MVKSRCTDTKEGFHKESKPPQKEKGKNNNSEHGIYLGEIPNRETENFNVLFKSPTHYRKAKTLKSGMAKKQNIRRYRARKSSTAKP